MRETYCMGCMRKRGPGEAVCPVCGFRHGMESAPDYALRPGTPLRGGRYMVGKSLGRGGFGITYVALDTLLGEKCAVKECFPSFAAARTGSFPVLSWQADPANAKMLQDLFTREAHKIAALNGVPGVVRVRDIFPDNNTAYIVMSFIDGETLQRRLERNGPMDPASCLDVLRPVMSALSAAHGQGIIHRDVSPDNIKIQASDHTVWLLDLGSAKEIGPGLRGNAVQSSIPIVKPGFSPPEQYIAGEPIGPWTDVYALCATAYLCMTGHIPPDVRGRRGEQVPIPAGIPDPVGRVLQRGLSLTAGNRQQSMGQLLNEFEAAVKEKNTRKKSAFPVRDAIRIAAALALVLLIGVGVWTEMRKSAENIPPVVIDNLETDVETPDEPVEEATEETPEEEEEPEAPPEEKNIPVEPVTPPRAVTAIGRCGDNATWTLYEDGELVISGTGPMWDYSSMPPWGDSIQSVVVKDGITTIGSCSFGSSSYSCKELTSVTIPNSVKEIGGAAFDDCINLTNVTIPDSVTEIGAAAFQMCLNLSSVTIPDGVKEVRIATFNNCESLISVTIPNGVTKIEEGAFNNCKSLTSITIPDSVTKIEEYAFCLCQSLTIVFIPDSVKTIGQYAFSGCNSLTFVSVPANAEIADSAFDETAIVIRRQ